MPRVRIHQHVNPLAPYYRQAPEPIRVEEIFTNPQLPLHLDLGSARGRFLLRMAKHDPGWNFLGVEIREPLVDEANRIAVEEELGNLRYAFCNAMLWLEKLIEEIPGERLQMVTIQFPDPWFKKKHAKRRMVNSELVKCLADKLKPGSRIFVQTDIEFLAGEMLDILRSEDRLVEIECSHSPFAVKTEREMAVEQKILPVYRAMFERL